MHFFFLQEDLNSFYNWCLLNDLSFNEKQEKNVNI